MSPKGRKRIIGKKGDLEHSKLIDLIIKLGLLLIVFLIIGIILRPSVAKLGEVLESVFPSLKNLDLFGTPEDKKPVVKQFTEEQVRNEQDCAKKESMMKSVKDAVVKEQLENDVFDCYLKKGDCEKGERFLGNEISEADKGRLVATCYYNAGDSEDFIRLKELITDEDVKKILNKMDTNKLGELKEINNLYMDAINSVGDEDLFKTKREKLVKKINSEKKYLFYIRAADVIFAKSESVRNKNCNALESLEKQNIEVNRDKALFPSVGSDANRGEPIGSVILYSLVECYERDKRPDNKLYAFRLIFQYPNSKATNDFLKNHKADCRVDNEESCNNFNPSLSLNSINDPKYKELKCVWNYGLLASQGSCASCVGVNFCSDYKSRRDCDENTCGFVGGCTVDTKWYKPGWKCIDKEKD